MITHFAEVKPDASLNGRPRLRCTACDKVAYASEHEAKASIRNIARYGGSKMSCYEGKCGWWHLSRVRR